MLFPELLLGSMRWRDLVNAADGMPCFMQICSGNCKLLLLCFHLGRRARAFVKHSRGVVSFETHCLCFFMVGSILSQNFPLAGC